MTMRKIFFNKVNPTSLLKLVATSGVVICLLLVGLTTANAAALEQAKRMHDRLAGIPPSAEMLCAMKTYIGLGNATAAAQLVMSLDPANDSNIPNFSSNTAGCGTVDNSASKKAFYSVSLKDYFTPWTNVEKTKYAPLNDMSATLIGMVRDRDEAGGVPFNEALYGDIVYTDSAPYDRASNTQYETLESSNADLSDPTVLRKSTQTLPVVASRAGIITTRAAGEAFFSAGTNRRMLDYMMYNFTCNGLLSGASELKDITRTPDRIRQDVTRSPGGDSSIFLNDCIGCHTGMDAMAGAFAYYEWDPATTQIVYSGASGPVQGKHLINATTFPDGYVTTDDSWLNYWREGPNERLQWGWDNSLVALGVPANNSNPLETDRVVTGSGANSLGKEIASTKAFAQCQVDRAYEHVCLQTPVDDGVAPAALATLVNNFSTAGAHSLKWVFANVAPLCMGN